jgi:hypothetical protein
MLQPAMYDECEYPMSLSNIPTALRVQIFCDEEGKVVRGHRYMAQREILVGVLSTLFACFTMLY